MYLCARIAQNTCKMFGKVGRVIDRAGLEIRYTPFGYRGFESLTFRRRSSMSNIVGLFFLRSSEGFKPPIPLLICGVNN